MDAYEQIKQQAVPVMAKSKMLAMAVEQEDRERAIELCKDIIELTGKVLNEYPSMLAAYVVATSGLASVYNAYERLLNDPFLIADFACAKAGLVRDFFSQHDDIEQCAAMYLQYGLHILSPLAQIVQTYNQDASISQSAKIIMNEALYATMLFCNNRVQVLMKLNPQNVMANGAYNMIRGIEQGIRPQSYIDVDNTEVKNMSHEEMLTYVIDFFDELLEKTSNN